MKTLKRLFCRFCQDQRIRLRLISLMLSNSLIQSLFFDLWKFFLYHFSCYFGFWCCRFCNNNLLFVKKKITQIKNIILMIRFSLFFQLKLFNLLNLIIGCHVIKKLLKTNKWVAITFPSQTILLLLVLLLCYKWYLYEDKNIHNY